MRLLITIPLNIIGFLLIIFLIKQHGVEFQENFMSLVTYLGIGIIFNTCGMLSVLLLK